MFFFSKNKIMGQSKWLIAEKKEFSRFGDIVILICEAVWGCGVGRGGIWNIKSSIGNSPSVSTLETASRSKRHLSSEVGARIPSTFSHSFFCERDIEL